MENNIDNKQKYFAAHWGAPIIHTGEGRPMRHTTSAMRMSYENSEKFQLLTFSNQRSLQLTSFVELTDEDALAIAKIMYSTCFESGNNNNKFWVVTRRQEIGGTHCLTISNKYNDYTFDFDLTYINFNIYQDGEISNAATDIHMDHVIDFIRSREYAIPWMGISVEELVKRKWLVLK